MRLWTSEIRRDLRNSGLLSAVIYIVPQGMQFVGFPLGLLVLMALLDGLPWGKHNEPFLWLLAWQFATWMAWFWALRSRLVWRFALAGPIAVGLTLGPMYWAELSEPLTVEDIAAKRPAEVGSWVETCTIHGTSIRIAAWPRTPDDSSIWIARSTADSEDHYYLLNPATCESTAVTWIPVGAKLADTAGAKALWSESGRYYISSSNAPERQNFDPGADFDPRDIRLSSDGEWVAWVQWDYSGTELSDFLLGVKPLNDGPATSARFRIPLEDPAPARLLDYDAAAGEATFEAEYNYLIKVNRKGQLTFGPFRPKACDYDVLGSYFLHPRGWAFYGGDSTDDCGLRWQFGADTGFFDMDRHCGGLGKQSSSVETASINRSGRLAAIVTTVWLNHHASINDSLHVIRLSDGEQVLLTHLALNFAWGARVGFAGDEYLALSQGDTVRVFEVPADLR